VFWAIVVNLVLTVAQIIGGVLSGSLALVADAIHNLSDALSLIIAFAAKKIARRPADATMTFGFGRAEIVAALINYTTLIVIGLYLTYEAILRFFEPTGVDGWLVVIVAGLALVVDAITAMLTYSMSKHSMNIRAAFLHNVADALGSVAVIFAGTLIILYDWRLIDPLVTLLIAGYILWMSFAEIGAAIHILMLGSPPNLSAEEIITEITRVDGVSGTHHVHLWQMHERQPALDGHIVIETGSWDRADTVKEVVKDVLRTKFDIVHLTLELECSNHACRDPEKIGHRNVPALADTHEH